LILSLITSNLLVLANGKTSLSDELVKRYDELENAINSLEKEIVRVESLRQDAGKLRQQMSILRAEQREIFGYGSRLITYEKYNEGKLGKIEDELIDTGNKIASLKNEEKKLSKLVETRERSPNRKLLDEAKKELGEKHKLLSGFENKKLALEEIKKIEEASKEAGIRIRINLAAQEKEVARAMARQTNKYPSFRAILEKFGFDDIMKLFGKRRGALQLGPIKPPTIPSSPGFLQRIWQRVGRTLGFVGDVSIVAIPPLILLDLRYCQELKGKLLELEIRYDLAMTDFDRLPPEKHREIVATLDYLGQQIAAIKQELTGFCRLVVGYTAQEQRTLDELRAAMKKERTRAIIKEKSQNNYAR